MLHWCFHLTFEFFENWPLSTESLLKTKEINNNKTCISLYSIVVQPYAMYIYDMQHLLHVNKRTKGKKKGSTAVNQYK
jgi:hypothetical protein